MLSCMFNLYFGSINFKSFFNLYIESHELFGKILKLRVINLMQVVLVGATLPLCGYILQKLLRNPLADPFILGVSSGGTFFSALFLMVYPLIPIYYSSLFNVFPIQPIFAFVGCVFSFLIIFYMRKKILNVQDEFTYIIIGIILNSFFSSLLLIIFTVAKPSQLLEIQNYLIGNIQQCSSIQLIFCYIIVSFIIYKLLNYVKYLDILLFGDEFAKSIGVDPTHLRKKIIFLICIIISIVIVLSGSIAFIGLIIPHIIKRIHRFSSQFEVILSMILGAIVLINADTLSRTLFSPAQLSIGIFTAILGAPLLSYILFKRFKI
ncbi:iron ABC transporter permease [Spirobacillus cienkowskii]|jgi:iron complex transport system permease protein